MTTDHVILATAPLRGAGLDTLRTLGEVVEEPWIDESAMRLMNEEQLAARISDLGASIVICEADRCAGPVLEQPLVAICSTRGDPTNVDIPGATAKGIPVLHAPGRNADGVAEMAIALLFATNRHVLRGHHDVLNGEIFSGGTIPYQRFRAWQLSGRTAGLVGLGAVGRALRWRLQGLGMEVLSFDPYAADATHKDLGSLLAAVDVVSMHAAVTPETLGMIGAEQFAQMRDGAIFLNTARAALHDTDALVDALRSGKLAGAGLDHFEGEMLPEGHPLFDLPTAVLTPHIGGATYDTEANHTAIIADDLARLLSGGRPNHCANKEVLA
ncbi:MAG: D-3-phosphoglycerate dehydrogenase / 2-oxoglutarate reductase [Acidimicrobiaceae bacterium]|jgi:D-3-phosphoglycerate dehydrogenase